MNTENSDLSQDKLENANQRINALEQKIEEMKSKLKAADAEQESLAYSVSHDLRAPLRAIDGYSRILEQDYGNKLDEEGLRILNIVRSSSKSMDELMDALLLLSRAGRCEMKLCLLNMNLLVDSCCKELVTPEIRKKITFTVGDLPTIIGDQTLIRQVWSSLISNSIKFSLPKEKPEIAITGFEDNDICTYHIKDNGVGFNPKNKESLFVLFQHLHKTGEFEGCGAGLTITQRIIHRHGGHIWGDGQLGEGAEFSFSLPKVQHE